MNQQTLLALNVALLLQLSGLAFAVLRDPYIRREHRRLLLWATFLSLTLVGQSQFPTEALQASLPDKVLTLFSIYGYCVRLVILALFMNIIHPDRRPWILVGCNALVHLTALFSDVVFTIRDGYFFRGPLGYFSHVAGTIQSFCLTDPDKAFDTIARFGDYLRQNLGSLDQPNLIPFPQELEHTKVYAQIEMLRFESLRVEYDIRDNEFSLPALTAQPLVENAIRHGVRIRKPGIVTVSSYRDGATHAIEVRDNGKGFDVETLKTADGTHIGLKNVGERIEKMCGGTMTIDSTVGEGTRVTLRLPGRERSR